MTFDEAWQLENVLTGTYVDSTDIDHPGIVEHDDYRFQVTDIEVEEPDHPLYRVAKRFGNAARYTVTTTVTFDNSMNAGRSTRSSASATDASSVPNPADISSHPYMRGVGGRIDRAEDGLTVEWSVPDRRRYEQRMAYFKETVEDLLG